MRVTTPGMHVIAEARAMCRPNSTHGPPHVRYETWCAINMARPRPWIGMSSGPVHGADQIHPWPNLAPA